MAADAKFDLVVRGGDVVLPDRVDRLDIAVRDGRIAALGNGLNQGRMVIDAAGLLVLPGGIDPHTHMGIPIKDTESADDFASGSLAAAFGGTTTILDFTVQSRGQTLSDSVEERLGRARGKCHVDFGIHVNLTDQPERRLDEIPRLIARGLNSFKAFSTYKEQGMMIDWPVFRLVLAEINAHGGLLMLHAEDNQHVSRDTAALVAAGETAPINHAKSRTPEAEARAIETASAIAGELGAALYVVHVSSRAGLEAGLAARRRGVRVHLETCPHYLVLDERKYLEESGHHWITTPPLRSPDDVQALWEGVQAGAFDTVGTDHCPFTKAQKDRHGGVFHLTPNGLPGVENRLAVLYTHGVARNRITLPQLTALWAGNAAKIFGIDHRKGRIAVGMDADLTIWDPRPEGVMTLQSMHGKADFTPYEGLPQQGRLAWTILRGHPLVADDRWLEPHPKGELIES